MKKNVFIWMFVMVVQSVFAQYDPKAKAILDEMSAKFKTYTSYKATFTYSLKNANANLNESASGDILVKGNKYRLKLPKQEVINNGTTVWTYMADANEVNISTYDPTDDDVTPSKIYTMYKTGYKYSYIGDRTEAGKVYQMIELVPEDRKNRFFKIKIEIGKTDKMIKSWTLYEKNGNIYTYKVNTFTPNAPADDTQFTFDKTKYKGVEIIDLR
jgi:outer membrane lipoprotein-sorting protein